jgi:hypothetical protein
MRGFSPRNLPSPLPQVSCVFFQGLVDPHAPRGSDPSRRPQNGPEFLQGADLLAVRPAGDDQIQLVLRPPVEPGRIPRIFPPSTRGDGRRVAGKKPSGLLMLLFYAPITGKMLVSPDC